ncbi:hypothetical protein M8818_001042 [Zalaria obscura]|uniref:Uncharacterized protein n=1 Tax=Zalaria obscura TaxID=2024903 RepID=A0ACC3SLG7_9PEZI
MPSTVDAFGGFPLRHLDKRPDEAIPRCGPIGIECRRRLIAVNDYQLQHVRTSLTLLVCRIWPVRQQLVIPSRRTENVQHQCKGKLFSSTVARGLLYASEWATLASLAAQPHATGAQVVGDMQSTARWIGEAGSVGRTRRYTVGR